MAEDGSDYTLFERTGFGGPRLESAPISAKAALNRIRFPEDRTGKIKRMLAIKISDSVWHQQAYLPAESENNPYWLVPFDNYKTFCPYLVGSYTRVSDELARYITAGYHAFILDVPPTEDEPRHTNVAFSHALQHVTR